jgi:tripartite-type tricarboxylate transporter receptor subunit TctC
MSKVGFLQHFLATVFSAALLLVGNAAAFAEYPERPVQFLVPWPPGDLEDVLTRLIAEEMQKQTGVPAAVINKAGAGGVVGATEVFQAAADGYMIGSFPISLSTTHIIRGNTPYGRGDFEPIGIFLTYPLILAARKDAPYNNMAELAEYAKSNPVRLAHFGHGLPPTLITLQAAKKLGFEFSGEAAFDVIDCSILANGDADVIQSVTQTVLPCLKSGDIKVLAAQTDGRSELLPDVPTMAEQVHGMDMVMWNGLFVKKGTPQEAKDKVAEIAKAVVLGDRAQEIARNSGALVYWQDADQAAARIDADYIAAEQLYKDVAGE